jgi:hypothetical protein
VLASVVGVGGDRQLKNNGVGVHGWQRTHGTCPAGDGGDVDQVSAAVA